MKKILITLIALSSFSTFAQVYKWGCHGIITSPLLDKNYVYYEEYEMDEQGQPFKINLPKLEKFPLTVQLSQWGTQLMLEIKSNFSDHEFKASHIGKIDEKEFTLIYDNQNAIAKFSCKNLTKKTNQR